MTRRHKYAEPVSVQEDSPIERDVRAVAEPSDKKVPEGKDTQAAPVKKKRIRHRQTVKLHNKKLSVSVICSNPYLRQFL